MAEEEFLRLLESVRDFDWNPNKREQTFRERHIAFDDAPIVFQGPNLGAPVRPEERSALHGVRISRRRRSRLRMYVPQRGVLDHIGAASEAR